MSDDFYAALGSNIRRRRDALGMTQSALAGKAGLSRTSITNIERGGQAILVHQLLSIAKILKVPLIALIPSETSKVNPEPKSGFPDVVQALLEQLEKKPNRSTSR